MLFSKQKEYKLRKLAGKGCFLTLFSVLLKLLYAFSVVFSTLTYIHETIMYKTVLQEFWVLWFRGVMVSTLDSESSDPSSNLGGTSI